MTPFELMGEYERRTNTHNFDNVAELIAEDAVYWFNDGSFRGRDEIRGAFAKTWNHIQEEKYAIEDVHWLVNDERVAVCIYTFHWEGIVEGRVLAGSGRGTSVLEKREGRWLVVHEHLSHMPPG